MVDHREPWPCSYRYKARKTLVLRQNIFKSLQSGWNHEDRSPCQFEPFAFSFPLTAIVSITHRITGIILFGGVAFALYVLDMALASAQGFC